MPPVRIVTKNKVKSFDKLGINQISLKLGKTDHGFFIDDLMNNRKLHTNFRLVPKSMTLDDPGPERPLRILLHTTCVFRSLYNDNLNDRPTCSAMTLVSGNMRFMWTFAGVSWRGVVKRHGVIENVDFQCFRTLNLRNIRK